MTIATDRSDAPASTTDSAFERNIARLRAWAPVLVLVVIGLAISIINPDFLQPSNFIRLLSSAAIPMVLVMGATFIILMGSIDLSVEGVVALAAVLAAALVANDIGGGEYSWAAIPAAIALGGVLGLINGLAHVKLRIPSFMATLGIGFAAVGVATAVLGGFPIRISDQGFRAIALARIFNIPLSVWIAFAAVAVAYLIQQRTRIGRWLYAIGGDEEIARHSGVPVERTRIVVFAIAGCFYGLGGAMSAAQLGQAHPLISQGRVFTAITAVVVGGTALSGGVGSVLNSVIGVLIVVVLTNGMVLAGLSPYVQQGVQGLLIIIAVALALDRSRLDSVK